MKVDSIKSQIMKGNNMNIEKEKERFLNGELVIVCGNGKYEDIFNFAIKNGLNTTCADYSDTYYYIKNRALYSTSAFNCIKWDISEKELTGKELKAISECAFLYENDAKINPKDTQSSKEYNELVKDKESILETLIFVYRNTPDGMDSDNINKLISFVKSLPNLNKEKDEIDLEER